MSPTATERQVRKAYKRLARKVHPDRDPSPEATARFVAVKAAHDEMLKQMAQGGYRVARPRPGPAGPPRRPPPRRPPPRAQKPEPDYVTYESPLRASYRRQKEREQGRTRPAVDPKTFAPAYRFEPSDVLRPALYIVGIGSWLVIMAVWATTLRGLNHTAAPVSVEPEPEVESPEPVGVIETGRIIRR